MTFEEWWAIAVDTLGPPAGAKEAAAFAWKAAAVKEREACIAEINRLLRQWRTSPVFVPKEVWSLCVEDVEAVAKAFIVAIEAWGESSEGGIIGGAGG